MRLSMLALSLVLAACAPSLPQTVESLSGSGDYENALDVVIAAMAAGDDKATELLPAVAEDAYADRLDRAREAEAEDELLVSLGHYDALLALGERVVDAGGPRPPAVAAGERETVARDAATKLYAKGSVAMDDGRPQDALDAFRMAEQTDPEATEAERWIPRALTALGHAARDDHRYREAIAHYDEAVQAGGGEEPRIWAAAVHAAFGRYALKQGACRKAVNELTAATALPFDVRLGKDLDVARRCATREVVVRPLEDMVEGGMDDNLGVLLVDQLAHHLRAHGSRYLRLLAPDSRAARTLPDEAGRRYEVRGHLTRVEVDKGEPETRKATAVGALKVPCQPGGAPECIEQVNISYALTTERLQVDLAGAIEVVDMVSGEQVATKPLDVRLSRVRFTAADASAKDVRGFGVQAPIGLDMSDRQIGVRGDARLHFTESEPLPDADKVIDEAMVRLAGEAADAVLASVDVEEDLDDPDTLILQPPVARAEDVLFREAPIAVEELPEEEPTEEAPEEGEGDEADGREGDEEGTGPEGEGDEADGGEGDEGKAGNR